jgi:16S rRNA (guanine(966)-N(2))-methyltransferase RsmD
VRIIAGRLKGRRLDAPAWPGLRPTSDKLRETLFNVLQHEIAGARMLDLFAGTGAVGIEALSRGAAHVTFVERDRRACRLLEENLRRCGVGEGYTIERADALAFLVRCPAAFDLVFVDPPYAEPDLEAIVHAGIATVTDGGVLVLEHASRRVAPEPAVAGGGIAPFRVLKSGDSALAFYRRPDPEPRS